MARKVISIDTKVLSQLEELRADPETYENNQERRSITTVIRKLLHDRQELAKIGQSAMSAIDNGLKTSSPLKSSVKQSKSSLKKSDNSIILFCFNCQVQTPQRKLKTAKNSLRQEFECSICGTKRSV